MRLLACLLILTLVIVYASSAQLINYDRLRRRLKLKGEPAPAESDLPRWKLKLPLVTTRLERRYDINRDGKLQTAEVKIYLRDTIETIEEKGGILINSDILLEYDKNNDGVISLKEIEKLRKDAGLVSVKIGD